MTPQGRSFLVASSFGFASVLVAGVAAYGVFVVLGNYQDQLVAASAEEPAEVTVPVANKVLSMGRTITAADVDEVQLRAAYVPATAILKVEDIVGRVPGERILPGDLVREERLAPAESGHDLDAVIASGMRARSVNLSGGDQVSGFLLPGNRVDVIVTLYDRVTGEVAETRTLVQAVRVLAVDDRLDEAGRRGIKLKPQVTLELAPDDAEKITHAQREGDIRLTLRSDIDFEWEITGGATTAALLGGTPGAERRTIAQLWEERGVEGASVVRVIHGADEVVERVP